jgi:DNA-binding protein H-NS
MNSLIDIQIQIEKLQRQAQEIRSKEFTSTVQDILAKMQAFGITAKDLKTAKLGKPAKAGRGKSKATVSAKAAKGSKRAGIVIAPKFRGPNGETWSGRGLTPKWLAILIAQGRSKDEFAIVA